MPSPSCLFFVLLPELRARIFVTASQLAKEEYRQRLDTWLRHRKATCWMNDVWLNTSVRTPELELHFNEKDRTVISTCNSYDGSGWKRSATTMWCLHRQSRFKCTGFMRMSNNEVSRKNVINQFQTRKRKSPHIPTSGPRVYDYISGTFFHDNHHENETIPRSATRSANRYIGNLSC